MHYVIIIIIMIMSIIIHALYHHHHHHHHPCIIPSSSSSSSSMHYVIIIIIHALYHHQHEHHHPCIMSSSSSSSSSSSPSSSSMFFRGSGPSCICCLWVLQYSRRDLTVLADKATVGIPLWAQRSIWVPGMVGNAQTELILGLRPANERRHYFVMTSLIGWAQT